jgi:predicted MFS family arabinose efflux permease
MGEVTSSQSALSRSFGSLRVPHFAALYASGWVFNMSRWGLAFLGAFVINQETASPRLVQLTGTAMWGPLLFAGLVGGAISDRIDRRSLVLGLFVTMAPLAAAIGLLELSGRLEVWVVFVAMLLVGLGWVVDMTARRALIFDIVGPDRINNAMALETVSVASGLALGSLLAGSVVELLGVGYAYLAIAVLVVIAALLMSRVPRQPPAPHAVGEPFLRSVVAGFRSLPGNPTLVSILGVTVTVNLLHFPFFPIVQVIGERLGASPFGIGALSAATGVGMMASALWVATANPHRGRVYVWGPATAMVVMLGFALFQDYLLVLLSLLVAAAGLGLFGATQGALIMTSVPDAMRGRALGLLSTAIGSLPIGMYALGELAEAIGASAAVIVFNLTGLVLLLAWTTWRPEARRQR